MKALIVIFANLVFLTGTLGFAASEGPCANQAKSGAIQMYKKEMGLVQGSEGISYVARLISSRGYNYAYLVNISDNNEDGDTWEVAYQVNVTKENGYCSVNYVKRIATR